MINEHFPIKIPEIALRCSIPPEQVIWIFDAIGGRALTNSNYLIEDGCHPNDIGYFHIANAVVRSLGFPVDPLGSEVGSKIKLDWLDQLGHVEERYYLECTGD